MALIIEGTPVFCQAVNCESPTSALVSSFHHGGWVAFCASHAVLQLDMDNSITTISS